MTKRQLERALADAEKLRDAWCAEYAKVRKRLKKLERKVSS